jgi:predicted Zn-dependent protease
MHPHFKPVNVVHQAGVSAELVQVVLEAIAELLALGNADLPVRNFGAWEQNGEQYGGVEWYLDTARRMGSRQNQIHAGKLLTLMWNEPYQVSEPHYDVFIVNEDLYDDGCNYVIGCAIHNFGTVISVNRFLGLEAKLRRECVRTEALHEIGHVFGLIPEARTANVEMSLGKHCTNTCTMRQGLSVPRDWIQITKERLEHGTFCPQCFNDLRSWFR